MTKLAENAWLSSTGTLEGFTDLDGVPAALELVDRYEVRGTIQTADPKDGRQRSSS